MCEETEISADYLGIKPRALGRYLTARNGPEAKFSTTCDSTQTRFFAFSELKAWWAKQIDLHEQDATK